MKTKKPSARKRPPGVLDSSVIVSRSAGLNDTGRLHSLKPQRNYVVKMGDNFHYTDESEDYELGAYSTFEQAVNAAKAEIDRFLLSAHKPEMTADDLYDSYTSFGEDPFIVSKAGPCEFSAWNYAEQRCREICDIKKPLSREMHTRRK